MSRYRSEASECKVYIGDLPRNADEKEIERAFEHYGSLKSVWVARNPPGFAFVEFEDPRDAQDAVRGLDGSSLCGVRVRVEHATGKTRPKNFNKEDGGLGSRREPPYRSRDSPRRNYNSSGDRCYICGDVGHASYDCPRSSSGRGRDSNGRDYRRGGSGGRKRSPSWSKSRNRSRSRSYSRSPVRSSRRSRSRN